MRHPLAGALLVAALCILRPSPSFAQVEEVRIAVDGLTCNLCAAGLERSLRTLPSVATVRVEMAEEVAIVTLKNGASFEPDKLRGAVTNAGQHTRRLELRLSGAVQRQDGRYSLRPASGASLLVARASAPKLEAHLGKVVRVRANVASGSASPVELELTDVVLR
jgi:cation transport ATPase